MHKPEAPVVTQSAVYVLGVCCTCLLCVAVLSCVQSGLASDSLSRLSHPAAEANTVQLHPTHMHCTAHAHAVHDLMA